MRSNALLHSGDQPTLPPKRPSRSASNVVCIHCRQTLGITASARKRASLEHAHQCLEAWQDRQPAAPPPYN